MNYQEIQALPLLFTSKPFGNEHVKKSSWEQTVYEIRKMMSKGKSLDDIHAILVHVSDARDGTSVYQYEIHG